MPHSALDTAFWYLALPASSAIPGYLNLASNFTCSRFSIS